MEKFKVTIVVLLPVLIGISACYVCIAKCSPLAGKEGGIAFAVYLMCYFGFLFSIVLPITIGTMMYIWRSLYSQRLKVKAFVLFLLFFALLVFTPFLTIAVLWRLR